MEFNLKKIVSTLFLTLGLSSAAFAGGFTPETCAPGNVTFPCEKTAWDIGFTGMYVQATNDDLFDYSVGPFAGSPREFETHTLKPDHGFAFNLQGSYHWGTGKDVNVNWTHLSDSDDASNISTNALVSNLTPRFFRSIIFTVNSLTSHVDLRHDAVNVEFGQTINVGEHINMRFHAGGQWARVKGEFDQFGTNAPFVTMIANNQSKFDGLGPRLGVDGSYHLDQFVRGFSIVGRGALAVLVGDLETDQLVSVTAFPPVGGGGPFVTTNHQKERTVVPSINGDLGIAYTHAMAQGDISFEAGYRVAAIYHSVRWAASALAAGAGNAVVSGQTGHEISKFGYHGPYATLKWMGNLA